MASAVVEVLGVFYFSTEVFASNITAKSESTSIIITNSQWPILITYAAGELYTARSSILYHIIVPLILISKVI